MNSYILGVSIYPIYFHVSTKKKKKTNNNNNNNLTFPCVKLSSFSCISIVNNRKNKDIDKNYYVRVKSFRYKYLQIRDVSGFFLHDKRKGIEG